MDWKHLLSAMAGLALMMLAVTSSAQISIDEFILSANNDHELRSLEEQIAYLDTKSYKLSPLQRTEFRTKSNQLDASRQDYALRFLPANPWETKNNNLYFSQYQSVLANEKSLVLRDALILRYNMIIDVISNYEEQRIKEEHSQLIDKEIAVLERQLSSDFFDGDEYIDLKLDQIDRSVEIEQGAFAMDDILRKMSGIYSAVATNNLHWNFEKLLPIDLLNSIADSLYTWNNQSASVMHRESQIELANREYKLKKSNVNLGFIQTEYEHFRLEQDRRPWSISMGVTLPITNPNRGDMAKQKLEVIQAQHKRDESKVSVENQKLVAYEQLKNLIKRLHDVDEKLKNLNASKLATTLRTMQNNPIASLRFQEGLLKLRAIKVKLTRSILLSYVEFLGSTDAIQQLPLVNYLSPGLNVINR